MGQAVNGPNHENQRAFEDSGRRTRVYMVSYAVFRVSKPSSTLCVKGPICTVRIEPGSMTASCGDSEAELRGDLERDEALFMQNEACEQPEG